MNTPSFLALLVLLGPGCTADAGDQLKHRSSNVLAMDLPQRPVAKRRLVADTAHSVISFRTMHFEIVELTGWFEHFRITMDSDSADLSDAVIQAEVDVTSLRMPNRRMMGTAIKVPYLDGDAHPVMRFMSTSFVPLTDSTYSLDGSMEVNGIERPMHFDVDLHGFAYPGEQDICGFTATASFDRHLFNVGTEDRLHSGRMIHADRIDLRIAVRME